MTKEKLVLAKDLLERINDLDHIISQGNSLIYIEGYGVKIQMGDFK